MAGPHVHDAVFIHLQGLRHSRPPGPGNRYFQGGHHEANNSLSSVGPGWNTGDGGGGRSRAGHLVRAIPIRLGMGFHAGAGVEVYSIVFC